MEKETSKKEMGEMTLRGILYMTDWSVSLAESRILLIEHN